ncbi:MAG: hypothetical protein NZV14_01825 [Bryobacteraceae bacterium]|nr:hypothetical protein [Bryobacteraceae bacterium]MDW8376868.1 hypothetical protein [Bryobacterales bacterium]
MSWSIFLAGGLLVFFLRDALLLRLVRWPWVWLYVVSFPAIFAGLGVLAERLPREEALALLRDPRFWAPAAGLHVGNWMISFFIARRAAFADWMALLLPAPMYWFLAGGLVWLALQFIPGVEGWMLGLLTGLVWSLAVVATSRLWRPAWKSWDFAAATNLTALILIPLHQESRETETAGLVVGDWLGTLLPLSVVVCFVAVSFLYHRYKSSRHAVHP